MKKILKHLKKNWIRLGFETFAVLVGVLAAFFLNDWSQSLSAKAYDKALLTSFAEELEQNIQNFEAELSNFEWYIGKTDSFLLDPFKSSIPKFDIVYVTFGYPKAIPTDAALKNLLSNENFRNLKYLELINESRQLETRFQYLAYSSDFLDDFWINDINPFYIKYGLSRSMVNGRLNNSENLNDILESEHFINLVSSKSLLQKETKGILILSLEQTKKTSVVLDKFIEQ